MPRRLAAEAWSQAVRSGPLGEVDAVLGGASACDRTVVNSCFNYLDPQSGMADVTNAWVCRPAVVYAVCTGSLDLLKVLLRSDLVDPNAASPDDGVTALHRAASGTCCTAANGGIVRANYSSAFLTELLKHPRIDVNRRNDEGATAL